MRFLLDTHVFIWMASDPERLSLVAKDIILEKSNQLYLSSASLWEMQIKANLGKLNLKVNLQEMWNDLSFEDSIELLKIENNHLWQLDNIGDYHKDPFDRILVAQAQIEDIKIITKDQYISKYNVETVW